MTIRKAEHMRAKRVTYTITPEVDSVLRRSRSPSTYICSAVLDRWSDWTGALGLLRHLGIEGEAIRQAIDALSGFRRDWADDLATQVQARCPHIDWARCEGQEAEDALLVVAREYWAGNGELTERLEGLTV